MRRFLLLLFFAVLGVALLPACRREERRFSEPASFNGASRVDDEPSTKKSGIVLGPYFRNAWAMGERQRLYSQMNCVGCHGHGGGGMGPPLMDGKWRHGSGATASSARPWRSDQTCAFPTKSCSFRYP